MIKGKVILMTMLIFVVFIVFTTVMSWLITEYPIGVGIPFIIGIALFASYSIANIFYGR